MFFISTDSTNTADGDISNQYTMMVNEFNDLSSTIINLFPKDEKTKKILLFPPNELSVKLDEAFKYTTKTTKCLGINDVVIKFNKFREKVYMN